MTVVKGLRNIDLSRLALPQGVAETYGATMEDIALAGGNRPVSFTLACDINGKPTLELGGRLGYYSNFARKWC
jgi:hypothetical protein